jgi:hypothetical protein
MLSEAKYLGFIHLRATETMISDSSTSLGMAERNREVAASQPLF